MNKNLENEQNPLATKVAEVLSFAKKEAQQDKFSGVLKIQNNGKEGCSFVAGYADKEAEEKNSLDTRFNIGSIGKMFTGVAIVQLMQEGLIKPGDTVGKLIATYPSHAGDITVHQLLTHSEGLPPYFNKRYIEQRESISGVHDYLELFRNEPLLFAPGDHYQYSNSGYVVLGAIIEAATNTAYEDYLQQHVFAKAGMSNTTLRKLSPEETSCAVGYTNRKLHSHEKLEGPRKANTEWLPPVASPAGGAYSTCEDLLKFSDTLIGYQLLNEEMTAKVLQPQVEVGSKDRTTLHYGYGFQILDLGNGKMRYGHAGGFAGVDGRLDMYPDDDIVVAVLANYDEPAARRIANRITEMMCI